MFNNLNISKSLLEAVSKVVSDSKEEYHLPDCLMESAKAVADDFSKCRTLEDRHATLHKAFSETVEQNKVEFDTGTVIRFEKAVSYFVANRKQ